MLGVATSTCTPCPVCDETLGHTVALKDRYGRALKTVSCARCGMMRVDPLPSAEELHQFYELEYRRSYKGVHRPKPKHVHRSALLARSRFRRLANILEHGSKVLDVGCGSGEWVYTLKLAGHSAIGIELDPAYAEFGQREYEVNIQTGSVLTSEMPEHEFDVITLFHVLEHLPGPVVALERTRRWLKDDGVLAVEVPNIGSPHQHPAKRFHYAHVVGFTPGSLTRAAYQSGWGSVSLSLDKYERNIFAIIRNSPSGDRQTVPVSGQSGAHPEPAAPLVCSASATLGYYLRASTYLRWLERMKQFIVEFLWTCTGRTRPREMVQRIARKA